MRGVTVPSKRYWAFGLPVDAYTMDETVQRCIELVEARRPVQHVVLNVIKVVLCRDDESLAALIRSCPLVNPDGMYFTWAARMLGVPLPERVAGIDLMAHLLASAEARGWPVYFLGAKRDVLDAFLAEAQRRYPKLAIVGSHDGYFKGLQADASVAADVRLSGARLLFVGLPSPRKERFIAEQLDALGPVFAMGVGGSFDVWAGLARRAPVWMQQAGLEWMYRLIQEPGRMWRRIVVNGWRFTWLFIRELVRRTPAPADA
jgi:N-acetylglucosaminyldiphosphoundecaprenol N-acetyl-beta-D-mannosaminyltransferase